MRQGQESAAQTGSGAAHGTEDEISNTEEAVCTSSERVLEVHGVWVLLCRWNRVFIYLHVYMCIYIYNYLFSWLCWVLVVARKISSCDMGTLSCGCEI